MFGKPADSFTQTQSLRWQHHLFVVLGSLFFLLWFIPFYEALPGSTHSLDAPNEKTRVLGMAAIGIYGELHINRVRDMWWCRETDLAGRPRKPSDGPYAPKILMFPGKTPGMALMLGPLYGLYRKAFPEKKPTLFEATYFARLFGTILPTFFTCLLFYLVLIRICSSAYVIWSSYFVFLLGTMTYPYALTVSSHSFSNGMLLMAFVAIIWVARNRWVRALTSFVGGIALGLAIASEYSALFTGVFLGFLALYVRPPTPAGYSSRALPKGWKTGFFWLGNRWHLLVMLLGSCIPVGVVFWFHKVAFGSYTSTPYANLLNTQFFAASQKGFMGFTWPPKFGLLLQSYFSHTYGLFFWTPFLLFFLPGMYYLWKRYRHGWYWCLCMIGLMGFWTIYHGSQFNPRGGWSVGPRYIANLVPFLALFAAWGADQLTIRYGRLVTPVIAGTAIWSISFFAPTSAYFPHIPDHSKTPIIEVVTAMLREGLTPINILGVSPGWATFVYFSALSLLLFSIAWWGVKGPNRVRVFVLLFLCMSLVYLIQFQLFPIDYNYRENRLDYIRGLIPPNYRW